jgi:hypothetical protein
MPIIAAHYSSLMIRSNEKAGVMYASFEHTFYLNEEVACRAFFTELCIILSLKTDKASKTDVNNQFWFGFRQRKTYTRQCLLDLF